MSKTQRIVTRGVLQGMRAAWGDISLIEQSRARRKDPIETAWKSVGQALTASMSHIETEIRDSSQRQ